MFLSEVTLTDVKCFESVQLTFQKATGEGMDRLKNWNVIIGDNGSGKTSLLQAIAGGLMDIATAQKMLPVDGWVRKDRQFGTVQVEPVGVQLAQVKAAQIAAPDVAVLARPAALVELLDAPVPQQLIEWVV